MSYTNRHCATYDLYIICLMSFLLLACCFGDMVALSCTLHSAVGS